MKQAENKDLVREQFTKTAQVFGDYAVAARGTEAAKLGEMVGAGKSESAIDIACGAGTLALRFARLARWVCGIDLTPAILARAKHTAAAEGLFNLDFALADAHRLPFADASLDIAVTSYALHHMPDAPRAIAEMARVVRRGGRVGVADIHVSEDRSIAELNDRIERARDASHTRTLTIGEFESIFRANGLCVTGIQVQENHRRFDHWLHVAGWHPGDPAYEEARRLMESTLENDGAGFHPRYEAAAPGAAKELMITNTLLLIAGEKI
ncbi:MAG TPA: class I SAM-dependent methyltransferase [Candidatus Acidoferrales bacterium]|nr:class I SAM-dependent methyltransferase [Candidatus Acidoferrales bacterium]